MNVRHKSSNIAKHCRKRLKAKLGTAFIQSGHDMNEWRRPVHCQRRIKDSVRPSAHIVGLEKDIPVCFAEESTHGKIKKYR